MTEITEDEMLDLMAQCAFTKPRATQMLGKAEKRQARRWLLSNQYGTIYLRGQDSLVAIRDVSITGMRLGMIPDALIPGDRVILVVSLEQGVFAVNAEVMHLFDRERERQAGMRFLLHYPQEISPLISFLENASAGVVEQKY